MSDIVLPTARPAHWRVPYVLIVVAFVMLLAMNWSAVQSTAVVLNNEAHNCRTKLGKMADHVLAFVLNTSTRCESDGGISNPFPLGIP